MFNRLYSRQKGWNDGRLIKYFCSCEIIIEDDEKLLDKSGAEILKMNINNMELNHWCRIFHDWYLYETDAKITSQNDSN